MSILNDLRATLARQEQELADWDFRIQAWQCSQAKQQYNWAFHAVQGTKRRIAAIELGKPDPMESHF